MPEKKHNHFNLTVYDGQKQHALSASPGENLLDLLRHNNILIPASCGGQGTCEKCRVSVTGRGMVLACTYSIYKDMQINLPGYKDYAILDQLNPHARHMPNQSGIKKEFSGEQITLRYKDRLIFSRPADLVSDLRSFGLAVDVGTTTVVLYLMDLNSYDLLDVTTLLNPQTAYGADVISRIEYTIRVAEGLKTLQHKLISQINEAIESFCQSAAINHNEIRVMTFVGNTIMLHILLGVDPRSIAFVPFTPVFTEEKIQKASELALTVNPDAVVRILPSIAGYIGADIVAGVASTDLTDHEDYTLFIDIGTNGEIVLGKKDVLYACSTAAGPAFEGAKIKCGVGGVKGGISVYEKGHYKTIGDQAPVGICGSGLIDIVAFLLENKQIDNTGLMAVDYLIEEKSKTGTDHDLVLTQKDIREVQLAKSAIYAGILTLIDVAGISTDQIGRVYLGGGFGNYIRISSAVRIGLLPVELQEKIIPVGNSAGTGALLALKSLAFEREIEKIKKHTQYIELSMRADFNEAYLSAMHFPR